MWLIYIFVFLQVAIGAAVLCTGLNHLFTARDVFKSASRELDDTTILVEGMPASDTDLEQVPIDYPDYIALKNKFSSTLDFMYMEHHSISFVHPDSSLFKSAEQEGVFNLPVIFISGEQFLEMFGFEMKKDCVYVGEKAVKAMSHFDRLNPESMEKGFGMLEEGEVYVPLTNGHIEISSLSIKTQNIELEVEGLPAKTNSMNMFFDSVEVYHLQESLTAGECAFISLDNIDIAKEIWPDEGSNYKTRLQINLIGEQNGDVFRSLDMLYSRHKGRVMYSLGSQYLMAQKMMAEATQTVRHYTAIAVFELLLVTLSVTGILYLIVQHRKVDLAISIMSGATFAKQVAEIIAEISFVVVPAAAAGLAVSGYAIKNARVNDFYVGFYPYTVAILILSAAIMILMSVSLSLWYIRNMSPVSVLQNS